MTDFTWVQCLEGARKRPCMYQGWMEDGHLIAGIREPLRLVWEKRGFEAPRRATLAVSPYHYHCLCETGPLLEGLDRLVEWRETDILWLALGAAARRLERVPDEWARRFFSSTYSFAAFSSLLVLAPRGVMAIRTRAGLWCQAYERGWPQTSPFLVESADTPVGLMVAAALSPQWCYGLPYTLQDVEQAVPRAARPYVTIEWHAEDDIVPECAVEPDCVLRPETIRHWLGVPGEPGF